MGLDLFDFTEFKNPFKPGAGHMPPYLAGRETEQNEFRKLLQQDVILENMILTGLRGVGKTVLLESLRPIGLEKKWLWVGTDLSESMSISEDAIAKRLLTDISIKTSSMAISAGDTQKIGFDRALKANADEPYTPGKYSNKPQFLDYQTLVHLYSGTPGLIADKVKTILETVWYVMSNQTEYRGVVFAYDEAQNLADHATKDQFPLSLLLDVFQSIQRKDIPFMLILTGLPTLYSKLIEARTYSERMFHIVELRKLSNKASQDAILQPIKKQDCPVKFDEASVDLVNRTAGGYPYFIQFICREVYDIFIEQIDAGITPSVPITEIVQKMDADFFAGRWSRVTDRQRELLSVAVKLEGCDVEFTVRDLANASREHLEKPLSAQSVNQMLRLLCESGLVYKNRHGKYSFAVPLLHEFIKRQEQDERD